MRLSIMYLGGEGGIISVFRSAVGDMESVPNSSRLPETLSMTSRAC